LNLSDRYLPAEQAGKAGHGAVAQAAGDDQFEAGQIAPHVDGNTVVGGPPVHRHADRGNLLPADPHPQQTGLSTGLQSQGAQAGDKPLFQAPDVGTDRPVPGIQPDDGIAEK